MFYTELIRPGLRLVALNTPLYYSLNFLVDHYVPDPSGQLAWLRGTLEAARKAREFVYVSTHIPLGYDEEKGVAEMWRLWNDGLWDLLSEFQDVITASFYGHLHYDSFRIYRGKNGTSAGFLTSGTSTREINPSVTMYEYSLDPPFTIIDRTNYYLDLDESNEKDTAVWKLAYHWKDLFGLKVCHRFLFLLLHVSLNEFFQDMSPASLESYVNRLSTDHDLFLKFWRLMKGSWTDDRTPCETNRCRRLTLCYMTHCRTNEVKECILSAKDQ